MLEAYRQHTAVGGAAPRGNRAALGIPPLPLDAEQTSTLCELLQHPPAGEEANLIALLRDRVPPGVDPAAYVKAGFLTSIVIGKITNPLINPIALQAYYSEDRSNHPPHSFRRSILLIQSPYQQIKPYQKDNKITITYGRLRQRIEC